jgi:hypothetical protein
MFRAVSPPIIRSSKTVHTASGTCQSCCWYRYRGWAGAQLEYQQQQDWHVPDAVCTVFELLMIGGETARNMYSIDNNKEYCITLWLSSKFHFTNTPYLSSSTRYSSQKEKRAKPGNLAKKQYPFGNQGLQLWAPLGVRYRIKLYGRLTNVAYKDNSLIQSSVTILAVYGVVTRSIKS